MWVGWARSVYFSLIQISRIFFASDCVLFFSFFRLTFQYFLVFLFPCSKFSAALMKFVKEPVSLIFDCIVIIFSEQSNIFTSTWFSSAQSSSFQSFQRISVTRFTELIQFWQTQNIMKKKYSVSLVKGFIFQFHIYFSTSFAFYFLVSYIYTYICIKGVCLSYTTIMLDVHKQ